MNSGFKLTKKDVLFLVLIIVFAAINLGAMGRGGRRRAKEIVCLMNLHNWGRAIVGYTKDNNGYLMDRGSLNEFFDAVLLPYYNNPKMLLCPEAVKSYQDGGAPPFAAWEDHGITGSYGLNLWVSSGFDESRCWVTFQVAGADNIPMVSDSHWKDVLPYPWDEPPYPGPSGWVKHSGDEMRRYCLNRHNGGANSVFMDLSARKVGLKELWELEWYRGWQEDYEEVGVPVWPEWMSNFKDYR